MKKISFLAIIYFLFNGLNGYAQYIPPAATEADRVQQERTRQQESIRRDQIQYKREQQDLMSGRTRSGMMRQSSDDLTVYEPFEGSRAQAQAKIKEARAIALADIEEINKKFRVPQTYLSKYPAYADNKKGGFLRIFPDKDCGKGDMVDVAELERCSDLPQVPGFGSKTSFRLATIPFDRITSINFLFTFPDIYFTSDNLKVGNEFMEILATEMGDLDLEKIDSNSEAVKFLKKWKESESRANVISNKSLLEKGIKEGNYVYSSSVPMKLNSVYALRSIAYYQKYKDYWNTDLLVAFKIVGQEKDGSIIVIWKQLQRKDAPSIRK